MTATYYSVQSRQNSLGFNIFPVFFFSVSKYNIYSTTSGHPDILLLRNTLNHNPKCRKACCKNFIPLLGCAKLNSCFKAKRLQLYPTTNLVEPLIFKTSNFSVLEVNSLFKNISLIFWKIPCVRKMNIKILCFHCVVVTLNYYL